MNARTIYRKLRRNHSTSFWGHRMYLTVATSRSVIPEPMPPGPQGIGTHIGAGVYVLEDEPGAQVVFGNPHGVDVQVPEGAYRVTTVDGVTSWWDVEYVSGGLKSLPPSAYRGLLEEFVRLEDWGRKWVDGASGVVLGAPVVKRLHVAREFATNCCIEVRGDEFYWHFTVKASKHLRGRRLRFVAAIRSAMKAAKKSGVSFRVLRGERENMPPPIVVRYPVLM